MSKVAPAPQSSAAIIVSATVLQDDIRGNALDKAMHHWQDESEDADASSIFGKQGFWVAKPAWYFAFLVGLWWVFDFTYCSINIPDSDMFGYRACKTPMMLPASFLAGASVTSGCTLLIMRLRLYAKPAILVTILAGVLHLLNALVILAGNVCTQHESAFNMTSEKWDVDRPCGFEMAIIPLSYGLCQIGLLILLVKPQYSIYYLMGGYCFFSLGMAGSQYLQGDSQQAMKTCGAAVCFLGAIVFFRKRYDQAVVRAELLTAEDYAKYRKVWEETRGKEEAELQGLEQVWKEKVTTRPKQDKRQPAVGKGPLYFPGRKWVLRQDPKLSDLFSVADRVNPILQNKCREWSTNDFVCESDHKGTALYCAHTVMYCTHTVLTALILYCTALILYCTELILYCTVLILYTALHSYCILHCTHTVYCTALHSADHKGIMARFHPGPVKKTDRALVKAFRSYNEDVGKLCDLCRCSLVFATISDLTKGLALICNDPDVDVQSCHPLKQRFALDYDDKLSAGYRDCQLSVKLKTGVGTDPAALNHLCEVQLHLRAFYEKKGDGGHKNYKVARNLRGA
jgi:cytochrome c556